MWQFSVLKGFFEEWFSINQNLDESFNCVICRDVLFARERLKAVIATSFPGSLSSASLVVGKALFSQRQGRQRRETLGTRLCCINIRELKHQTFLIHERHGWTRRSGSRTRFTRQMQIIKQTNVKPSRTPTE